MLELLKAELAPTQTERWRNNPTLWCAQRLPSVILWPGLEAALNSVRDHPVTALQSGNGLGKSMTGAIVVLWWLDTHTPCKVMTTGSSWRALREHLWPYIHTLIKQNNLYPNAAPNDILDMQIALPGNRSAYAASTNDPEGIAGAHSEWLLQVVEEGSGVTQPIAEAIQGNSRGDTSRELWMGNPLAPSGAYFEKCQSPRVNTLIWSALEHPNVLEDKRIIPGAVMRSDIERDAMDWCAPCAPNTPGAIHLSWQGDFGWYTPSPVFIARVLGEFPEIDLDALINSKKLDTCGARVPANRIPSVMGVDVARSEAGDETVFALGNEFGITEIIAMREKDLTKVVGRILHLLTLHTTIKRIAVDDVGLGGGVTDMLRANEVSVLPINFGDKPTEKTDTFLNLKAQMYWEFKDRVERDESFCLPNDQLLLDQAKAFRPGFGMQGSKVKVKIEDKAEYKKRTGYSPDRAEACILATYCTKYASLMEGAMNTAYNTERDMSSPYDEEESTDYRHVPMFR